jgi:solute carrier family 8 (sodium/calcium exchanger)
VVTALPPEEADVLGPGTIVGSASFNLLLITAICILSPSPNTTKVEQYGVFLITAFFAVEAYIWLLIIIDFNTPEVAFAFTVTLASASVATTKNPPIAVASLK